MIRFLSPSSLWQRLLIWLPAVLLCYALLTAIVCMVADALQAPPEAETRFWLPIGFIICMFALVLLPVAAVLIQLAAYLLPGRSPLTAVDNAVSMTLLPALNGALVYISCDLMTSGYSWPPAPAITASAAAAFTMLSLLIPHLSKWHNSWVRTLLAIPVCWLWGLSLAVFTGGIIDCNDNVGLEPVAVFPYSIFILPLVTAAGLLPAWLPMIYIENKSAKRG